MVDNLSIGLTHVLMAIALWRLLQRDDLDNEVSPRDAWRDRQQTNENEKAMRDA